MGSLRLPITGGMSVSVQDASHMTLSLMGIDDCIRVQG